MLKAIYSSVSRAEHNLPSPKGSPISEELLTVIGKALEAVPKRGKLVEYMATCSSMTLHDGCAVLRLLYSVSATLSPDTASMHMECLRGLCRLNFWSLDDTLLPLCHDLIDASLLEVYTRAVSSTRMSPNDFVDRFEDVVSLVLPMVELKKVLELDEQSSWVDVKDEILHVTSSSLLGDRLYGWAAEQVLRSEFKVAMGAASDAMFAKVQLQESDAIACRTRIRNWIKEHDAGEALDKKRQVSFTYRGWEFKETVADSTLEIDIFVQCRIRAQAARLNLVTLLPGEKELAVDGDDSKLAVKGIDKKLLLDCVSLRQYLGKLLKSEDVKQGTAIEAILKSKRSVLHRCDRLYCIETSFVVYMCGTAGAERLQQRFNDECVPSETVLITPAAAREASTKIMNSDLWKFVNSTGRGVIEAMHAVIVAIEKGMAPKRMQNSSPWVARAYCAMLWFAVYVDKSKTEEGGKKGTLHRGQAALTNALAAATTQQGHQPDDIDVKYKCLDVFGDWLTPDEKKQWADARKSIMKVAQNSKKGAVAKKSEASNAKKRKGPTTVEQAGNKTARQLLGLS